MSTVLDAPQTTPDQAEAPPAGTEAAPGQVPATAGELAAPIQGHSPMRLVLVAGGLSGMAAAWMAAGIFQGILARPLALVAAAVGAGAIGVGRRARGRRALEYLGLPVVIGIGVVAALTAPNAGGGGLVHLVEESIRAGFGQPPVPFDPGWRLLLVVFCGLLAAFATSVAFATDRPKLAVGVVVPVVFGAALRQPASATVVSAVVSLGLLAAAFAAAYGADLARAGSTSGEFETRRLLKGGAALAVLLVALLVIGQAGLLIPHQSNRVTIPPKRPQAQPLQADHELFRVRAAETTQVWRLGVLDGYDGQAFLTPPYDSARLRSVPSNGALGDDLVGPSQHRRPTTTVTFTLTDVPYGVAPVTANPLKVKAKGHLAIQYDPRTQTLRLPGGRPRPGTTYTVEEAAPPTGADLEAAPPPPAGMRSYLAAPAPPPAIRALLAKAPTDLFDRMQFMRMAYYRHVVAAGGGEPAPVPPARVVQILHGQDASPFEITAGEVLLARWAGVPARMGYGYYGGEPTKNPVVLSVHPKDGSTWLEAYFQGYGWVPVIGTPPRARASFSNARKNHDKNVLASNDLALVLYVPVMQTTIQYLFVVVRFYLVRVLPLLILGLLGVLFYPALFKLGRRARRRRWAAGRGPVEQVLTAYAEWRDAAIDFNLGLASLTPIEFLDVLAPDPEHRELAWLVSRLLWGDLRRDPRTDDVLAAREMVASLGRRLRRGQPLLARATALAARTSLRAPFTEDVPNLWPQMAPRMAAARAGRRLVGIVLAGPRLARRRLPRLPRPVLRRPPPVTAS